MTHECHDVLLGAYSMGVLDDQEAAAVEAHLAGCAACHRELAELNETRDRLAEAPPEAFLEPSGDAPEDLLLRRTLRSVRANRPRRSHTRLLVAATVAAAVLGLGGGVLIGGHDGIPTAPASVTARPAGVRTATGANPAGGARLTASVLPANGWVRVKVRMTGVPPGVECRIVVTAKDGSTRPAGSWRTSAAADPPVVDGAAAVAPADVAAVTVATAGGEPLVTVPF